MTAASPTSSGSLPPNWHTMGCSHGSNLLSEWVMGLCLFVDENTGADSVVLAPFGNGAHLPPPFHCREPCALWSSSSRISGTYSQQSSIPSQRRETFIPICDIEHRSRRDRMANVGGAASPSSSCPYTLSSVQNNPLHKELWVDFWFLSQIEFFHKNKTIHQVKRISEDLKRTAMKT